MLVVIGGFALGSAVATAAFLAYRSRRQAEEQAQLAARQEADRRAREAQWRENAEHRFAAKREAQQRAKEEHWRAEQARLAARQESERQVRDSQRKAEEEQRLAAEREAQQQVEEERRRAEQAQRIAQEESERQAREAQQKAEDEQRLSAEREAQQQVEVQPRIASEIEPLRFDSIQGPEVEERVAAERAAQRETKEAHRRTDEDVCRATEPEEQREADEESQRVSEEFWPDKSDDGDREASPAPVIERTPEAATSSAKTRPRQPAVHRDRRGSRRASPAAIASSEAASAGSAPTARLAAEAKLRLSLHPIRRTARMSVVLTRPDGFPERVTLQAGVEHALNAYDAQRYDDVDLPWTGELLAGELRLASTDGFRWVRSARRVHIFAADPNEPDLISVGAAQPRVAHALVCRSNDVPSIRSAAASVGSPDLHAHEHWQGIPEGWMVLSGYTPTRTAEPPLPNDLRPLDPGSALEIVLEGGLAIRPRVYAEGHPPRILIRPAGSASITIGGQTATLSASGAWEAPGWNAPGQHIVDVVPGPSASYEIAADPWAIAGWDFWNAHSGRLENQPPRPWARAEICGARIRGPAGETVLAAETLPTLIALGLKSGVAPLHRRGDVSVSVGFMAETPAFLLAATGPRRTQGRVIWLGLAPSSQGSSWRDPHWVSAVNSAASRRLPLQCSDALGKDAWRKAKERARRLKRPRS